MAVSSFRRQGLRLARTLTTRELQPWRQHRPLVGVSPNIIYSHSSPCSTRWSGHERSNYFSTNPPSTDDGGTPSSNAAADVDGGSSTKDSSTKEGNDDVENATATATGDDDDDETKIIAHLESQIKDLKDNLLRSLAEQENTRRIAARDVANAKSFAVSSFAKSLLDTSDNLTRALEAVPEGMRTDQDKHPILANLFEGITMTEDGLNKAFAKNGLVKFGNIGEKFDPNVHMALFEYPDPAGSPGHIGQVMKVGFMLNDRVIRSAEVGVVKAS